MDILRKDIIELLIKQEAESKRARRDKKLPIAELWTHVLPDNYGNFIFHLVSTGKLSEFLAQFTETQEDHIYVQGPNYVLKQVLLQDTSKIASLFSRIPFRMKGFFNSEESYSVFSACNLEQKLYIVEMCSEQLIIDYLSKKWAEKKRAEVLDFLEEIEDEGIAKAIFKKIADALSSEIIARLLEMARPNTTCRILEQIKEKENLSAVCLNIADKKFYHVLEKCNFSILAMDSMEEFPIEKLSLEEKAELCLVLRERLGEIGNLYQKFGLKGIIELFSAGEFSVKGDILFGAFSEFDDFDLFYTQIVKADKMDMLQILAESNQCYRKIAFQILKKREIEGGLNYFELLVLNDLS